MRVVRSVVGAVVLVAGYAIASDAPATDAKTATPPPEDPIAAAKRDLEAIKAAKGGLQPQGKVELPSLSGSDLSIGPQAPWQPAAPGKSPADAAKKKSATWLVDAMMKKPSLDPDQKGRPLTRDKLGKAQTESEELDPTDLLGTAAVTSEASGKTTGPEKKQTEATPAERPDRVSNEPVINPLANFMAGWMTPQDYKLLQSEPKSETASAAIPGGSGTTQAHPSAAGSAAGAPLFGQAPTSRPASAPRDNPFLQDFAVGLPTSAKSAAPALPPAVAAAPAAPKALPPPPESPAQKPATPAFVKPNDDAKYFKPLKRF